MVLAFRRDPRPHFHEFGITRGDVTGVHAAHGAPRHARLRRGSRLEAVFKVPFSGCFQRFFRGSSLACSNIKISEREKRKRARAYKRDFPLCRGRANPLKLGWRCVRRETLVRSFAPFQGDLPLVFPSLPVRDTLADAGRCRYLPTTLIEILGLLVQDGDVRETNGKLIESGVAAAVCRGI